MRHVLFLPILLLPLLAQGQSSQGKCLVENDDDNTVSGKLEYVSFEHPGRPGIIIAGYKLVLTRPRCYEFLSPETQKMERNDDLKEIAINNWSDSADVLEKNVGKFLTATGVMETNRTIYYVVAPQLYARIITPCEMAPKTNATLKCP